MPPKRSGRVQKFIVGTGEIQEGRSVDTIQLFLPDGTAIDLSNPEAPEAEKQFAYQGAWEAGAYEKGDAVNYGGDTYYATDDTEAEPGVTGLPTVPNMDLSKWAEAGPWDFDTTEGGSTNQDPWAHDQLSTVLYIPALTSGNLTVAFTETFDDHYISYYLIDGDDMSLEGTGSSDTQLGPMSIPSSGDWYLQMFHDDGFDTGHDAGPVSAVISFTGGLTVSPAPGENPWVPL